MFGFDPYSPRTTYNPASMRAGSFYNSNPFATAYNRDHLARDRYVRALQEQQVARQAYADALAQREVQRLEDEYATDPYAHAVPRSASQYLTGDDDEEDYSDSPHAQYILRQKEQQRAALERQREQQLLAEQERQAALEAAATRRSAMEARRARQQARYEAEQRALEEERTRRAQHYHSQHPARSQRQQPHPADPEPTAVRVPIQSSTPTPPQQDSESPALDAISKISSAASDLRKTFQLPPSIDFVDSADKPTLSYASANRPIRAYEDAMSKLLEKLDAVESAGVTEIREARRRVVKEIEGALQELEGQVEGIWKKEHMQESVEEVGGAAVEAPSDGEPEEMDTMTLDGEDSTTLNPTSSSEPSYATQSTEESLETQTAPQQEPTIDSSVPLTVEGTEHLAEAPSPLDADMFSQEPEAATSTAAPEAAQHSASESVEGQQQPSAPVQYDPWSTFDVIV